MYLYFILLYESVILYSLSHEPPKGCVFLSTCCVLCHAKGCVGSGMVKYRRRICEPKCHSVHFIHTLRICWGQTVLKSYLECIQLWIKIQKKPDFVWSVKPLDCTTLLCHPYGLTASIIPKVSGFPLQIFHQRCCFWFGGRPKTFNALWFRALPFGKNNWTKHPWADLELPNCHRQKLHRPR